MMGALAEWLATSPSCLMAQAGPIPGKLSLQHHCQNYCASSSCKSLKRVHGLSDL